MKTDKFARGGKRPMLGKGDRTKSSYPADPQKPARTAQHDGKPTPKRRPGRGASDTAGDMGGSAGVANPRRPAA